MIELQTEENKNNMRQFLVYDLGGTFIKFALMNENFEIISQDKVPSPTDNMENLLAAMRKAVDVHEWRYVEGILKKGGASAEPEQEQAPKAQAAAEAQEEVNWL